MTLAPLTYSIVTPAHNEAANLPTLSASIRGQKHPPLEWIIVDDGSVDETSSLAASLGSTSTWIRLVRLPAAERAERGGPVVRSFVAGLAELQSRPDVIVKLDADISFDALYFERLLTAFAANDRLGIASGSAYEVVNGAWTQRFGTGTSVWGASRAYRRACLEDVSPLVERTGWDTIDEHIAQLRGWDTATLLDLPFWHHRSEGERDGSAASAWRAQGNVSHYLGYRPSYVVLRAGFNSLRDPAALQLLRGYAEATLRRAPRYTDNAVIRRIRTQQRFRNAWRRFLEARGRNPSMPSAPRTADRPSSDSSR